MPERIEVTSELIAGIRADLAQEEIAPFFERAVHEAMTRIPPELIAGPIVAVYHHDTGDRFDVTIGMPVSVRPDDSSLEVAELPAGPALRETHHGEYPRLGEAYDALRSALAERGLELIFAWERYLVGPAETDDPASFVTEVITPLPS